jgi:HeH/LEM domain
LIWRQVHLPLLLSNHSFNATDSDVLFEVNNCRENSQEPEKEGAAACRRARFACKPILQGAAEKSRSEGAAKRPITADDVINCGEYLNEGFNPNSLTISFLRGILHHHRVELPKRSCKKADLVTLFSNAIAAESKKWKQEWKKNKCQPASADGIINGITGVPIMSLHHPSI